MIALSAVVFALFVLPRLGGPGPASVLLNGQVTNNPLPLAVGVFGLALASGATLIGIGVGRWKRPRPSAQDGSLEI